MARALPGLLVALLAAPVACTTPRTQIILLIETDMPQGPTATLTHVRVTVGQPNGPPRQRLTYRLGGGATGAGLFALPGTLGISALDNDGSRSVEVKVDAVSDPGGPGTGVDALFTYTAIAPFEEERTLLMPVFLAGRCRTAPPCDPGFTCGRERCEQVQRTLSAVPVDFRLDATATDATDAADDASDDLATPDAPAPDAPAPDVTAPDATVLDAPDATAPDATAPDVPAPDAPAPDAPTPDAPAPDVPAPDAPAPDVPAPDVPAPDAPFPDAPVPDVPLTCAAPRVRCGGVCVDLSNDPLHCGSCAFACPALPNATATCGGGACRFTCTPGFSDCDMNPTNGCELQEGAPCTSPSGCATGRSSCRAGPTNNYCEARALATCGTPCPLGTEFGACDGLGVCRGRPFACDGGVTGPEAGVDRDGGIIAVDGPIITLDGALM